MSVWNLPRYYLWALCHLLLLPLKFIYRRSPFFSLLLFLFLSRHFFIIHKHSGSMQMKNDTDKQITIPTNDNTQINCAYIQIHWKWKLKTKLKHLFQNTCSSWSRCSMCRLNMKLMTQVYSCWFFCIGHANNKKQIQKLTGANIMYITIYYQQWKLQLHVIFKYTTK